MRGAMETQTALDKSVLTFEADLGYCVRELRDGTLECCSCTAALECEHEEEA